MTRLRVLRVIARMNVGGPALQVTNLMQHLDGDRYEQRLLTGTVGDGEADFVALRAPDLDLVRIDGLGPAPRATADLSALAAIRREIRTFRPHIVHTHTAKAGVLGRVAARSARVPFVVHTFHGHLLRGYFSPAATRGIITVERALARVTTRLLTVGERVRDDLLAAGIGRAEQYRVVPPGIMLPPPPSRREARRTLQIDGERPVVVFVARLTQIKRPDRVIDVARRVAQTLPDALFLIVGEGPLLSSTQQRAAGLEHNVRFLGWRADVEVIYAAADVALLVSDNEGMPVSLIEAAMCGCPAVTTDVGSASEVVADGATGAVVPGTSTEALASALIRVIDAGPAMGIAARSRAMEEFSGHRLVRDVELTYEEINAGRFP